MSWQRKTYFTSDTHFGHRNILEYCNRPFLDIVKMNRALVANWNAIVKPEDTIYHIGDFALGSFDDAQKICQQLNGYKILIRGNHDKGPGRMIEMGFDFVCGEGWYKDYKLRHIPWKLGKGQKGLCGHVHERWTRVGNLINVGSDVWNYTPRTLEELEAAKQTPNMKVNVEDQQAWRKKALDGTGEVSIIKGRKEKG